MLAVVSGVQTSTYRLVKQERQQGKILADEGMVKVQSKPLKVYIRQTTPVDGMEILYVTGQNHNRALINPNAFPWVNINLDPRGARVRQGRHHTIYDVGFRRIAEIIQRQLDDYRAELPKLVHLDPQPAVFDGRRCWVVQIDNPYFKYVDYTIKSGGESLDALGLKLGVSEHMIGEKLPGFDGDYQAVLPAGKVIQVPSTYARRMTMLIDQGTQMLVSLKVVDDQGLYELFEYHDLKINVPFRPTEFTPDFQGYNF